MRSALGGGFIVVSPVSAPSVPGAAQQHGPRSGRPWMAGSWRHGWRGSLEPARGPGTNNAVAFLEARFRSVLRAKKRRADSEKI